MKIDVKKQWEKRLVFGDECEYYALVKEWTNGTDTIRCEIIEDKKGKYRFCIWLNGYIQNKTKPFETEAEAIEKCENKINF